MLIKNTKQSFVCYIGSVLYFSYHKHVFWKDLNQHRDSFWSLQRLHLFQLKNSFSKRSQIYTYISTEG